MSVARLEGEVLIRVTGDGGEHQKSSGDKTCGDRGARMSSIYSANQAGVHGSAASTALSVVASFFDARTRKQAARTLRLALVVIASATGVGIDMPSHTPDAMS